MSFQDNEAGDSTFLGDLPDDMIEGDDTGNPNFEVNAPIADIAWAKLSAARDKEGSDPFGV